MVRISKVISIIWLCVALVSGSEVISAIKKFVPTPTEAGFLVNAINVYMQVSQFVRSTNKLIRSVSQTKEAWEELTREMEDVFTGLGKIKEIDPYNMSTWDIPLAYAQNALTAELWDVQLYFDMFDRCIIGAPLQYIKEVATLDDYNFTVTKAGELVRKKYFKKEVTEGSATYLYYQNTLQTITSELMAREWECNREECSEKQQDAIRYLMKEKQYIEDLMKNAFVAEDKSDSLVAQAEEIIKINLTEIRLMKDRMAKLQVYATKLIEQYYNLTGNKVAYRDMITKIKVDIEGSRPEYDADDADKVPPPPRPADDGIIETGKDRDVNQQDILALQNAIEFCMLQQEGILRDIEIMKVNTLAMITVFEANRRWESTEKSIETAIYAKRLSYED